MSDSQFGKRVIFQICHPDFTWNTFLLISEGQKEPFWEFLTFLDVHLFLSQNQNSAPPKMAKIAVLKPLNSPNLISRKI